MQTKEMKILKIEHNNNMVYYTQEKYGIHKSRVYEFLSNVENVPFEIIKLFETVFPEWKKDTLDVIRNISCKLIKENKNYLLTESKAIKILTNYCTKKINLEFLFIESNLEELSCILIKSFHNIEKLYNIKNFTIFHEKFELCREIEQQSLFRSNIAKNKPSKKDIFPSQLKELSDYFLMTKSIKLIIPINDFDLYIYLLPLLNTSWLFSNLLQIELDLTTSLTQNYEDFSDKSLILIKKNKEKFLLMIFYCYFISKMENLKYIKIRMFECYLIEIDCVLKEMKVLTSEFHFLNFLSNIFDLNRLSFHFNCLDSLTFEKIICLIHRNNYLQNIDLNFFPPEEYCSVTNLAKIGSILNINLNRLSINHNNWRSTPGMDSIIDDVEYILNQILEFFERNMDRLFFVLRSKDDILNLNLKFYFPNVVSSNDKYLNIFLKFLFNIFFYLENPHNMTQTLKIKSSNIFFEPKKNSLINHFLKNLNLSTNKCLRNLSISLKFISVINLEKLFTEKLEYLNIGDLCLDTFSYFTTILKSSLKELKYLKISINNIYFDLTKDISIIYRFFSCEKPKELEEIYFRTSLPFSQEEIIKIIDLINYDSLKKYKFVIAKKNFVKKTLYIPKTYYTAYNKRTILNLLFLFSKKKIKNLKENKKVFENFRNLFKKIKQKEIEFVFI